MNVLLLSMPDSFEHMPPVAIRMPNGALTSLAGNVDAHHRVAVANLILARTVRRLDIVTFGRDLGSITVEFERATEGRTLLGRQSQTWVRLPEGWRIVAAHVSLLP